MMADDFFSEHIRGMKTESNDSQTAAAILSLASIIENASIRMSESIDALSSSMEDVAEAIDRIDVNVS